MVQVNTHVFETEREAALFRLGFNTVGPPMLQAVSGCSPLTVLVIDEESDEDEVFTNHKEKPNG